MRLCCARRVEDPYSFDAPAVVAHARHVYDRYGEPDALCHGHFDGGHDLTDERVTAMLDWLTSCALRLATP